MEFEWDPNKATANLSKHAVSFETAARAFADPFLLEIKTEDDDGEIRDSIIGAVDNRLLHVTYVLRDITVLIISARAAEPHERRKYHEG